MFKLYRLKDYNFRLVLWLAADQRYGCHAGRKCPCSLCRTKQLFGVILGVVVMAVVSPDRLQLDPEFLLDHVYRKYSDAAACRAFHG